MDMLICTAAAHSVVPLDYLLIQDSLRRSSFFVLGRKTFLTWHTRFVLFSFFFGEETRYPEVFAWLRGHE